MEVNGGGRQGVEDRLKVLIATVNGLHHAVKQGQRVDLSGLDGEIGDLCVAVINGRPESRRFVTQLNGLIDSLDDLKQALKRQHETQG